MSESKVILPPAMLGMLGGGQLGRFFVIAAHEMGYKVTVLDPDNNSPAGKIADVHICAKYDDESALKQMADTCQAVHGCPQVARTDQSPTPIRRRSDNWGSSTRLRQRGVNRCSRSAWASLRPARVLHSQPPDAANPHVGYFRHLWGRVARAADDAAIGCAGPCRLSDDHGRVVFGRHHRGLYRISPRHGTD